ncbi:hypothetical protein mO160R [Vaccinia virus]|uniref:Uncharacterized protein n=2 Tax=Vaccinia virus TaxID=10245 RepID=Q49PJ4_VACC0|nr:hypothetical protein m8160R [Vaccinia virus]AAW23832.1 hypothetical protein mO160R [Vaccinia virus]ABZ80073.1 unknown [synthetic Vaccinia virus]BBD06206.1 putative A ORF D [BAC cloning vector pLC16m8.8S-BAC]
MIFFNPVSFRLVRNILLNFDSTVMSKSSCGNTSINIVSNLIILLSTSSYDPNSGIDVSHALATQITKKSHAPGYTLYKKLSFFSRVFFCVYTKGLKIVLST